MRLLLIVAVCAGFYVFFSDPNSPQVSAESRTPGESVQVLGQSDRVPQKLGSAADSDVSQVAIPTITVPEDKLLPTPVSLSEQFATLEDLVDEAKAQIITSTPNDFRYVTANSLNVRRNPGTSSAIISKLSYGARVAVVSSNQQGWLEISQNSGEMGWVFGKYISVETPVSAAAESQAAPRVRTISAPSSAEIRKSTTVLIQQSIASYAGSCPCPYNRDRGGRRCGKRSAWSRPGGYSPICYDSDVSKGRLDSYFARLRGATN